MDLSTITTAQFQAQFWRDFPYLPVYDPTVAYGVNQVTTYNSVFYNALQNNLINVTPGSDGTKWQKVAGCLTDYVNPLDITNAFAEAQVIFNQGLFGDDATVTLAYLYLTAHYLVNDLRTASQGVNSTGTFAVTSKSAGSMSESYEIPEKYMQNPQLQFLTTTGYGMKFLSFVIPTLVGNIGAVCAQANP